MAFVYHIHRVEDFGNLDAGYIGYTSGTVANRWQEHKEESRRTRCAHYPLYRAMNKYQDIVVSVILEGSNEYCLDIEYKLRPTERIGWNICRGGEKGALGRTHSEETRRKISEAQIGRKHKEETKAAIIKKLTGLKRTDESRKKMSESAKKRSPEHQQKLNIAAANISEETRKKMSESAKNLYKDGPWSNPLSNKLPWLVAEDVYKELKLGVTYTESANSRGFTKHQFRTLFNKIKAGWVPSEDLLYQKWLNSQKEAENAKTQSS